MQFFACVKHFAHEPAPAIAGVFQTWTEFILLDYYLVTSFFSCFI